MKGKREKGSTGEGQGGSEGVGEVEGRGTDGEGMGGSMACKRSLVAAMEIAGEGGENKEKGAGEWQTANGDCG